MLDLDRSANYDVTSNVIVDEASQFVATRYGQKQTLTVSVNLRSVNPVYNNFTHVQIVDVFLNSVGTTRPARNALANWQVAHTANTRPLYGNGVYATFYASGGSSATLRLIGDAVTQEDWLARWYYNTRPLYNPQSETQAPAPTHFVLQIGATELTYPISAWNQVIALNQALTNNSPVHLVFIRRTPEIDLILSRSAAPLWQVDLTDQYI
jgi:hypothetical protein